MHINDIEPGYVLDDKQWQLRTGWASHTQPWLDSIAYRLETNDGSIVFAGDTKLCDEINDLAKGADTLLCMCWDDQDRMDSRKEANFGMCGTGDAATIAARAGVKQLVLVHSHSHPDDEETREEAFHDIHQLYEGDVVLARDGLELTMQAGVLTDTSNTPASAQAESVEALTDL